MKKQCYALAVALGLGGFAASANVAVGVPQSEVIHWATVVLCDFDGDRVHEICVEGHTGFVVREFVDVTLSALPGSPPTRFLAR